MENEEKGILVEQVVQADRIRTHGKFHERLFLLLRIIYFLIGMLGVVLGLALTYEIELNYVLLVVGTIVIGLLITAAWELPISRMITWPVLFGIYLLAGIVFHNSIFSGLLGFYNSYAGYINEYYGTKVSLAAIEPVSAASYLITLLFAAFLIGSNFIAWNDSFIRWKGDSTIIWRNLYSCACSWRASGNAIIFNDAVCADRYVFSAVQPLS